MINHQMKKSYYDTLIKSLQDNYNDADLDEVFRKKALKLLYLLENTSTESINENGVPVVSYDLYVHTYQDIVLQLLKTIERLDDK